MDRTLDSVGVEMVIDPLQVLRSSLLEVFAGQLIIELVALSGLMGIPPLTEWLLFSCCF